MCWLPSLPQLDMAFPKEKLRERAPLVVKLPLKCSLQTFALSAVLLNKPSPLGFHCGKSNLYLPAPCSCVWKEYFPELGAAPFPALPAKSQTGTTPEPGILLWFDQYCMLALGRTVCDTIAPSGFCSGKITSPSVNRCPCRDLGLNVCVCHYVHAGLGASMAHGVGLQALQLTSSLVVLG